MREHNKPCHNPSFCVMWSKKSLSTQISLNKHVHNQIVLRILSACLSYMKHWTPISWHPTRSLLISTSPMYLKKTYTSQLSEAFLTEIRRERRAESLSLQLCPGFSPRQDICPLCTLEQFEFKRLKYPLLCS